MGTGHSSRILTYKEACTRLSEDDLAHYTAAFRRLTGKRLVMDKSTFLFDVLGEFPTMPGQLAEQIFESFDTSNNGSLSQADFVAGMVVVTRGTEAERLRFVFNTYDIERSGALVKADLLKFHSLLRDSRQRDVWTTDKQLSNLLEYEELGRRSGISLDDFLDWASQKSVRASTMVKWVDDLLPAFLPEAGVLDAELDAKLDPRLRSEALAGRTGFDADEVSLLRMRHSWLKGTSSAGRCDVEAVTKLLCPALPEGLVARLFAEWDTHDRGWLAPPEFISALSLACRGSLEERAELTLRLHDIDGDGILSTSELAALISLALALDAREADEQGPPPQPAKKAVNDAVAKALASFGDDDKQLTAEGWLAFARSNPAMMAALAHVREVTLIELGLQPPEAAEEMAIIRDRFREFNPADLREGEQWAVISRSWWMRWLMYVSWEEQLAVREEAASAASSAGKRGGGGGGGSGGSGGGAAVASEESKTAPGKIDNLPLIRRGFRSKLSLRLTQNVDYVLVPGTVWTALSAWYGGRPELLRSVISSHDELELELYPMTLVLTKTDDKGERVSAKAERLATYSKVSTLAAVLDDGCKVCRCDRDRVRLWTVSDRSSTMFTDLEATLEDAGVADGDTLLLEVQLSDGSWPRSPDAGTSARAEARTPGLVGLNNLGNTCYMNSSLQCLSNVRLLTDYFVRNYYLADINTTSALGTGGKLAMAYGALMKSLWAAKAKRAIAPHQFKRAIGKDNSQFNGFEQQDAQELLSVLLSSLNEDLNRIAKKPYIEQPDSNGRADQDVALQWWRNHLQREVSIIVSLLTGQFRSLLTCEVCSHSSARFEPFMFLQLPLPEPPNRFMIVTFYPSERRRPVRVSLSVPKDGSIADLKDALVRLRPWGLRLQAKRLVVTAVSRSCVDRVYGDSKQLKSVTSAENTFVYEVDAVGEDAVASAGGAAATRPPPPPPPPSADSPVGEGDVVVEGASEVLSSGSDAASPEDGETSGDAAKDGAAGEEAEEEEEEADEEEEEEEDEALKGMLKPGTKVEARWHGKARYYYATVDAVNRDGTYALSYDDGDYEERVRPAYVRERIPTPVLARFMQRKLTKKTSYFLNPLRPRLMGYPLVLRFLPEATTGRQLYEKVWRTVQRFSPRGEAPATMEQFGFALRYTNDRGDSCSRCSWVARCLGCLLPCDDALVDGITPGETLVIDWDAQVLEERFDDTEATALEEHDSIEKNIAIFNAPLSLESCLTSFTSHEKLDGDGAYCEVCRTFRPSNKSLVLWRLPPVLIVQLKRFQYNSYTRSKLHNLVEFPLTGLDFGKYIQPDSQRVDLTYWHMLGGRLASSGDDAGEEETKRGDEDGEDSKLDGGEGKTIEGQAELAARARGIDTSLYDLSGVVNHFGALGAGHYVAYCKSPEDGRWRCYNDSRVRDIDEGEVCSQAAYLLFYVRRDISKASIEDLFPPAEGVDFDELDAKTHKPDRTCVIC
eukprot:PLAT12521.3.p1 GENE.PLAT12521.3~~PLAT12521.3.p1  ORF type:complete len:1474 (-),score=833.39 PLAT12521.3:84-4505(-)